jgi:putative chitinase
VRYKGRGPIQITGRANYKLFSEFSGHDFISHPEDLEHPVWGALAAGWFWYTKQLNSLADQGDFKTITRRINGGLNGYTDRCEHWERAKKVLGA